MAVLVATSPVAAQESTGLDVDSSKTPDPEFTGTYEKAVHDMNHSTDVLDYQDDSGNWQTLNASLQNVSNPISFDPTKVSDSDLATWPSANNSSLDSGAYSVTASTATMNVTNPGGDVKTLSVNTTGLADTETATAAFSNVSITTDAAKHNAWVAVDVQDLSGTAAVAFVDSDGDRKELTVNSSKSASNTGVLADGTGVYVAQPKLSDLSISGSGDGSFDAIESIEVVASDGDVDLDFTTISAANMDQVSYGTEAVDTDGDGTDENVSVYEPTGMVSVQSLDSLPSMFDDAEIYDVQFDFIQASEHANVEYEFSEERASEYQYKYAFDVFYEFHSPDVLDLKLQSGSVTDTVAFPTNRLLTAEVMDNAPANSSYEDLRDSTAWTSLSESYEAAGDNSTVTVEDTPQQGERIVLHEVWLTSGDDQSDMTQSGGPGVPLGGAGSGIIDFFTGLPGMFVAAVSGYGVLFRNWLGKALSKVAGMVG